MKLSLSDNIRLFRKQRKLTQEKLAEALGVTVGAVYKWEAGLSQPELGLLVEMADFFDTSVDVLIGYKMKDNQLHAALERINEYSQTLDPEALVEAEKILGKYPHSFLAVHVCADIFLIYGATNHDPALLQRAVDLFEQAIILFPQNDDPRINKSLIYGDLSIALVSLGKQEEGLALMQKNNAGGLFNGEIGLTLSIFMGRPEEAVPYLSEAFVRSILYLIEVVASYCFVFRSRNDWDSALSIIQWGITLLTGLQGEAKTSFIEKNLAVLSTLHSYILAKIGKTEESQASLEEAARAARHFDLYPSYSLDAMRFVEQSEKTLGFDLLGATAAESIETLIRLLDDQAFADKWEEIMDHES